MLKNIAIAYVKLSVAPALVSLKLICTANDAELWSMQLRNRHNIMPERSAAGKQASVIANSLPKRKFQLKINNQFLLICKLDDTYVRTHIYNITTSSSNNDNNCATYPIEISLICTCTSG